MSVPTTIRLFTCSVMLALLPVYGAQSDTGTACGQSTYSDLTGTITSPNYPNNYQNYQTCNYYIDAPSLSTINFTFSGLGLQQSTACVYDWIEFTCESNPISQPIRFCGFGYREELSFKPCSRVLLRFASDGSATYIGFSVSYEIEPIRCQGDCTPVTSGSSYSCPCDAYRPPFIPSPYDQCDYGCYSNSIYCACSFPPTNVYSTPQSSTTRTTILHSACGQGTYSSLSGNITSLNYPNNYQNYQTCNYYIDAPSLSTINFTFNGLSLEQSTACVYDWIEITCESNSISQPIRYCGFGYREELSFKPCSRVLVSFVSDGSVTNIGFSVSYDIEPIRCQGNCTPVSRGDSYFCPCDANQTPFIPPPYDQCPNGCFRSAPYCACSYPPTNVDSNSSTSPPTIRTTPNFISTNSPDCGQSTYSDLTGSITSLNYPNYYQNNQNCNYYIDAPSLSTITFTFNGLGLEQNPLSTCYYDWIEFTCESNSISQPIRYCGFGYRPQLSFKPCSRVRLSFVSDGSVTNIGFSVSYEIEPITCGQSTYNNLTGNITSLNYPNNYQSYQTCNYYIDAPSLSSINFTFNGLGLEQSENCYYDWIEFTCESNSISQPIRYCGFGYRPELSFKPCSRVLLRFTTDQSVTNIGFSVSYEIEPIRCQGDCTPVSNGASHYCPCDANQTPFIPPPYDQCPYGCFSSSPYCACSYPPTNVDSNSSTSPPTMRTTPHFIPTEFSLLNSACGLTTYSNLAGIITSPNYPNFYQNYQTCSIYIQAPSLSTINITFNVLGLEQSSACVYDWVELTGESNSISRSVRYCGFGNRSQLSFKPCSRVLLRFISDGSVTNIGFSVSYAIEPIRCQGGCTPVANGTSYYCPCDTNQTPFIPPPYDQCPNGCFSSSPYCACSYPPTNVDSNSSTSPPTIRSTPHFISTDSPVLRSDCGQSTYSNLTGSVTSPNYPNYYQNNQNCIYYIDAPSLSTITFTFNALALERSPTCYYDLIEFTCMSNSISQPIRYCGFGYRPELSFKPCSRVRLWFYSDISATNIGFSVSYEIEPIRCQGDCAPVSDGASYYCPCDANPTPFVPQPYDQCLYGCYSSLNPTYCACSYPNFNSDSNSSTSPPFSTDSYLEQSFCSNNPCLFGYCVGNGNEAIGGYCLCVPGYTGRFCTVVIDDNSSGNVSPSATTRPPLVTPTSRPATVNFGNSSGYVSQFATTRPSFVTPTTRPATVTVGNSSGFVPQFATTRPSLVPPNSRQATVNVGNSSGIVFQSTTTRPSNVTARTTPRPVTPNEGNRSSSSPHVPRQ